MQFIQQTLTSMEVADMIEKAHKDLMRDIRRYTKQFNESNLAPVEFWSESAYKDGKGETRPCYNIYKKGCEFIAHKLTGTKGTIFTAKYINRFHEMETAIQTGIVEKNFALPEQASIPAPRRPEWYIKSKERIFEICERKGVEPKRLYYYLIRKLGQTYDLATAREVYKHDRGCYPEYDIDIVGYFPELSKAADKLLERMEL